MKSHRIFTACMAFVAVAFSVSAADHVMFHYQARVLKDAAPFDGATEMKVAIVATSGTQEATLWSNDGSSVAGEEPGSGFLVDAAAGIVDVMIGDAGAGMDPIHGLIFHRDDALTLRVWINVGDGFQRLSPDRPIVNPRHLGLDAIREPVTLYVDGTNGNDLYDGLTTDTAKRTIQAAIDMLPRSIYAPVAVNVADGTYAPFEIIGFSEMDANLTIVANQVVPPTESTDSNVIIDGQGVKSGVVIKYSDEIVFDGLTLTNVPGTGFLVTHSSFANFFRCKVYSCQGWGFVVKFQSTGRFTECISQQNTGGFDSIANSYMSGANCVAANNSVAGIACYDNSTVKVSSPDIFEVKNNPKGIVSTGNGYVTSSSNFVFSGNTTNTDFGVGSVFH